MLELEFEVLGPNNDLYSVAEDWVTVCYVRLTGDATAFLQAEKLNIRSYVLKLARLSLEKLEKEKTEAAGESASEVSDTPSFSLDLDVATRLVRTGSL